jgi:hypothetical protein
MHCGCQLGQGQQIVVDERNKAVACAIHFEGDSIIGDAKIVDETV